MHSIFTNRCPNYLQNIVRSVSATNMHSDLPFAVLYVIRLLIAAAENKVWTVGVERTACTHP